MGKGGVLVEKMNSALGYYACGEFLQVADERQDMGSGAMVFGPQYGG